MREILFRGKDVKENWHIGLLAKSGNGWYISNSAGIPLAYEVIPSTIGQYTGLTDEKGTKIFEGDIVDVAYDIDYAGIAAERIGVFKIVFNDGCFMKRNKTGLFHFIPSDKCKVIGNIHDNPELLKEVE